MNLDERLRDAADRLNADLQQVPVPNAPTRGRTPWRAVAATALVTIVAVGSVAVLLGPGSDDEVVTARQTTTTAVTSTAAVDTDLDPPPRGAVHEIASGMFEGTDQGWTLSAYTDIDGRVCMVLGGPTCPHDPTENVRVTTVQTGFDSGVCLSGAVHRDVTRLELRLEDGTLSSPVIHRVEGLPARFYVECWGSDVKLTATAFGAGDEVLETFDVETTLEAGSLFDDDTGVVLLFDDAIDGVLAVAPDGRRAARSVVAGQVAGDQDPRLHRTGDHLVVGWGEITAVDVRTREATPLGEATVSVPAAEQGRVWLVDRDGQWVGGRAGEGQATAWQVVAESGRALTDPMPLDVDGDPVAGIPGGLALATDDGVALWADGEGFRRLGEGDGPGSVIAAHRNRVAWCSADCDEFHVTHIYGTDQVFPGPIDASSGRFSPDGLHLAFTDGPSVRVLDFQTGTVDLAGRITGPGPAYVGWSPDGTQLFASTYAYGEQTMELLRYRLADRGLERATLPFGGALDFVVIDEDEATLYFDSALEESCTPSGGAPGRQGICTFEF